MNFQQIQQKLDELNISKEQLSDLDFDPLLEVEEILGPMKVVQSKGGEGQGEEYYVIIHFVDHNVFVKVEGFYTSYDGTDFDAFDLREVFPTEKIITVYEKK